MAVNCSKCSTEEMYGFLLMILLKFYLQQAASANELTSNITVKFRIVDNDVLASNGWELANVTQVRKSLKQVKELLRKEYAWIVVKLKDGAIKGSGYGYVIDLNPPVTQLWLSKLLIYSCPDVEQKYDQLNARRYKNVASWEACSKRCSDRTSCQFWTWISDSNRYCYVMENPDGKVYDSRAISGPRLCKGKVAVKAKATIWVQIGRVVLAIVILSVIYYCGKWVFGDFIPNFVPDIRRCLTRSRSRSIDDGGGALNVEDRERRFSLSSLSLRNSQQYLSTGSTVPRDVEDTSSRRPSLSSISSNGSIYQLDTGTDRLRSLALSVTADQQLRRSPLTLRIDEPRVSLGSIRQSTEDIHASDSRLTVLSDEPPRYQQLDGPPDGLPPMVIPSAPSDDIFDPPPTYEEAMQT